MDEHEAAGIIFYGLDANRAGKGDLMVIISNTVARPLFTYLQIQKTFSAIFFLNFFSIYSPVISLHPFSWSILPPTHVASHFIPSRCRRQRHVWEASSGAWLLEFLLRASRHLHSLCATRELASQHAAHPRFHERRGGQRRGVACLRVCRCGDSRRDCVCLFCGLFESYPFEETRSLGQ